MSFLTETINYTDSNDFSFDSAVADFTGSAVELKNIRPANSTFYAGYHTGINGEYGNGSLTGTGVGSPTVASNLLDLRGGTLKYVSYPVPLNADQTLKGTIRLIYIPNYSGAPSAPRGIFAISDSFASLVNLIEIQHFTDGFLYMYIYNSSGTPIVNAYNVAWSPVASTQYEFEFDWNIDVSDGAHAVRLFINGIQIGTTQTNTGIRTSTSTLFRIGSDYGNNFTADAQYTNVIIFNTVQHTANFASEIPRVAETQYPTDVATITQLDSTAMSGLINFSESAMVPSTSAIRYHFFLDDVATYWDGAAWSASNGSYAQSNSAATIDANVSSLDIATGVSIRVVTLLSSTNGAVTPVLTSNDLDYLFFVPAPDMPPECIVYAFLEDILADTDLTDALLIAEIPQSVVISNWIVGQSRVQVAFSSGGYAQLNLKATASVDVDYSFSITYKDSCSIDRQIFFVPVPVPNQTFIALPDLTTIVVPT